MEFDESVEPIEEIAREELDIFLKSIFGLIHKLCDFCYNIDDRERVEEIGKRLEFSLKTLAYSIQKSLSGLFRDYHEDATAEPIREKLGAVIYWHHFGHEPYLPVGAEALYQVYDLAENYKDKYGNLGPAFEKMSKAVMEYKYLTQEYISKNEAKLKGKKGGSSPKKPQGIVKVIHSLIQEKIIDAGHDIGNFKAAELSRVLWDHFKENYSDSQYHVDSHKIFYNPQTDKLEQMDGNDRKTIFHSLGFERFKKHVSSILKEMKYK